MKLSNFKKLNKTFIIAEIGNNHEGNVKNAKKLINLAAKAGVDAVKFQTFKTENFVKTNNKKRFNQLKKFQLSFKQFKMLKKVANKNGLKFISTPLDYESLKFLTKNSDLIKIASSDNNFIPLINEALRSKKSIIISTGMTNFTELKYLKKFLYESVGEKNAIKRVSFLHCVTSYPVDDNEANLNSIKFLNDNFNFTIGYSDHTIGTEACIGAAALGAKIIEKHFTLNKKFSKFRDHSISADFNELKKIVCSIRKIEKLTGVNEKKIQKGEVKFINQIRRQPYAKKNLNKNEKLTFENTLFLRTNGKNNFNDLSNLIGKKTKKKNFEK